MTTLKLTNNAIGTLTSDISESSDVLSLVAGQGAKFPQLNTGEWHPATLVSEIGTIEIVRVTKRIGDVLYIERAKEGTLASAFLAGSKVALRITAGVLSDELERLDTALATKAALNSPNLIGVPTAPTAPLKTNTTQVATMAAVQAAIADIVGSSPETLNQFNELAAALGNDPNFATTVMAKLAQKLEESDVDALITAGTAAEANQATLAINIPTEDLDGNIWIA